MKTSTAAQLSAIQSDSFRILVLAGPGSGKTQTSVDRVKRLVEAGTHPGKICAITFTNNAAREFEKRVGKWSEPVQGSRLLSIDHGLGFCGTLHGFALRGLRKYGHTWGYGERIAVIDENAMAELLLSKAKSLGCKATLKDILEVKTKGPLVKGGTGLFVSPIELVISGYYEDLREGGLVDFDSLLSEFLLMITKDTEAQRALADEFGHLFVDEVQDSAAIDWQIYDALLMPYKFFVGDPDQAIYSFRGGRVDEMMRRAKSKTFEVIRLEENFRSHSEICEAANWLIANNTNRIEKKTISAKGAGGHIGILPADANEGAEISRVSGIISRLTLINCSDFIPVITGGATAFHPGEIAILARTNDIVNAYRRSLKATGIPVAEQAKTTVPPDWHWARSFVEFSVNPENDTLAYFLLIAMQTRRGVAEVDARATAHRQRQEAALAGVSINQRIMKHTKGNLGTITATLIGAGASKETHMKVLEIMRSLRDDAQLVDLALAMGQASEPVESKKQGVTVTTMHGAKGLEFDVVFIVGAEDEITPSRRNSQTAADIEEERRLFFVAVTRARKALYIAHAASRVTPWKQIQQQHPSRFIAELLP